MTRWQLEQVIEAIAENIVTGAGWTRVGGVCDTDRLRIYAQELEKRNERGAGDA